MRWCWWCGREGARTDGEREARAGHLCHHLPPSWVAASYLPRGLITHTVADGRWPMLSPKA
eukprot:2000233-Prymnesium_polylepis.1